MSERRGGRLATEPQFVRMPRNWGRQTSLFQWRQPAFWLYAVIVLVTAVYTISQQQLFQKLSPSGCGSGGAGACADRKSGTARTQARTGRRASVRMGAL